MARSQVLMTPTTYSSFATTGTASSMSMSTARQRDETEAKARDILRNLVSVADLQSIVHYQTSGLLREPRATTNTIQRKISRRGGDGIKSRDVPSRGVPIRADGSLVSPLILASRTLNKYASNTRGVDPGTLAQVCEQAFLEYDTDRDGRVAVSAVPELLRQLGTMITGQAPDPTMLSAWKRRAALTHGSHITLLGLVDSVQYMFGDRVSAQPRNGTGSMSPLGQQGGFPGSGDTKASHGAANFPADGGRGPANLPADGGDVLVSREQVPHGGDAHGSAAQSGQPDGDPVVPVFEQAMQGHGPAYVAEGNLASPPPREDGYDGSATGFVSSPTHTMRTAQTASTLGGTIRQAAPLPATFQGTRQMLQFERLAEASQGLRRVSYGSLASLGVENRTVNMLVDRDVKSAVSLSEAMRRQSGAIRQWQREQIGDVDVHERLHRTPLQSTVLASEVQPRLHASEAAMRRAVRHTNRTRKARRAKQKMIRMSSAVVSSHMSYISRKTTRSALKHDKESQRMNAAAAVGRLRASHTHEQAKLLAKRRMDVERKRKMRAKRDKLIKERLHQTQSRANEERERVSSSRLVLARRSPLSPSPFRRRAKLAENMAKFPPPKDFRVPRRRARRKRVDTAEVELGLQEDVAFPDAWVTTSPTRTVPPSRASLGTHGEFMHIMSQMVQRQRDAEGKVEGGWGNGATSGTSDSLPTLPAAVAAAAAAPDGAPRTPDSVRAMPSRGTSAGVLDGPSLGAPMGASSFPILPMRDVGQALPTMPQHRGVADASGRSPSSPSPIVHRLHHDAAGSGAGVARSSATTKFGQLSTHASVDREYQGSGHAGGSASAPNSPATGRRQHQHWRTSNVNSDHRHGVHTAPYAHSRPSLASTTSTNLNVRPQSYVSPPGTPTLSASAKVEATNAAAQATLRSLHEVMGVSQLPVRAVANAHRQPLQLPTKQEEREVRRKLREMGMSQQVFATGYGLSKRTHRGVHNAAAKMPSVGASPVGTGTQYVPGDSTGVFVFLNDTGDAREASTRRPLGRYTWAQVQAHHQQARDQATSAQGAVQARAAHSAGAPQARQSSPPPGQPSLRAALSRHSLLDRSDDLVQSGGAGDYLSQALRPSHPVRPASRQSPASSTPPPLGSGAQNPISPSLSLAGSATGSPRRSPSPHGRKRPDDTGAAPTGAAARTGPRHTSQSQPQAKAQGQPQPRPHSGLPPARDGPPNAIPAGMLDSPLPWTPHDEANGASAPVSAPESLLFAAEQAKLQRT